MDSFQKARDALRRIEEARRAEETARREQQEAWGRLQEALAELRSSSPSLQAMPVEALLQTAPGAPSGRAAFVPPLVAPSNDGAGGDDGGLTAGPGDELALDEWDLPPGLDKPVEGEDGEADGFWKGVLLTDDDVEGAATDPFPVSE